MCLVCLNYIFCIACLKVIGLTSGHSWSISCIVQPLVLHIGLSLRALLPLVGVKPHPNDRVTGSKRLHLAAFEQIKFCKVDGGRVCWIYPGNQLIPPPNVDRTSLLNQTNLYLLLGDEELAQPTPPSPPPHPRACSSSQPSLSHDYPDRHAALRSIQEEQASL